MSSSAVKRPVAAPGSGAALLSDIPPSLGAWYADPIPAARVCALGDAAQRRLRSRLIQGHRCFPLHVLRMICRHWTHSDSTSEYRRLSLLADEDGDRALLELVYGQLLISGKRLPARRHLARGFALAAPYLAVTEYFVVVRRHELLASLPLGAEPAAPRSLQSLLSEAAVIRRLTKAARPAHWHTHEDASGS